MKPVRRMGPNTSANRVAMLDAAERVLQTDGHAALSSRRIAQEAGLNRELVYYYFHTIDDLTLATFRRCTERALAALKKALRSERPLQSVWTMNTEFQVSRLTAEFMAIANYHEGIRAEVKRYQEESRALEAEAFGPLLSKIVESGIPLSPAFLSIAISSLSNALLTEADIGLTRGHDDVQRFLQWCFDNLEST